jgi:hypothetical protein
VDLSNELHANRDWEAFHMSGGRETRWLARQPLYCVTVVESGEPARVLAGFGAEPGDAVAGGPRKAMSMVAERFGYRPVVRVVPVDGWVVAIELYSLEGVRPEVLRRLGFRAVAVGVSGDGMRWLGYTDGDGWVDRVETAGAAVPGDSGWERLVGMAERASVSLHGWAAENLPTSSMRFMADVCGFEIDDDLMAAEGFVGVALPVLPPVATPSARLAQTFRSVPDDALDEVATRHVGEFLRDAGADDGVLAEGAGSGVRDESTTGVVLRELMAETLLATGAAADPNGPWLLPPERATALRLRADAAHAAHAFLAGGPEAAITAMLQRRRSAAGWRERMLGELGVGSAGPGAALRARSLPFDTSGLRPAPTSTPKGRAVRHPDTRPGPADGPGQT